MADWKEAAAEYFFTEKKTINEIAGETGVSRQSISAYLSQYPGYQEEKELRKQKNAEKRRRYKQGKNREYRAAMSVTKESIRREHEVAVAILSAERY